MKKNKKKGIFSWFIILIDVLALACFFVFYGPVNSLRNTFITTGMTTMTHKYLVRTMYSEDYISKVLNANKTEQVSGKTDVSLVKVSNEDTGIYESIYEEQILKRDEGNDLYKVINISGDNWNGYIVAVYDPSRVKAATAENARYGAYTSALAKKEGAIIAINGGGFERRNNLSYPLGIYIEDGEIVYGCNGRTGQLIGFNKDNVLVLMYATAEQAVKEGIRDAMEFGPYLVVNGVASTFSGDGGYGYRSRTAIGQRKDGTVLLVVIDGKRSTTGVSMPELTELFVKYGAYNAANLDGGGSSVLVINNEVISDPKGYGYSGERWNVDAWIVK